MDLVPSVILGAVAGVIGALLSRLLLALVPGWRDRDDLKRYFPIVGVVLMVGLVNANREAILGRIGVGSRVMRAGLAVMSDPEIQAALKAEHISGNAEAQAWARRMASEGLRLLDDDRLIRRRTLLTRMLDSNDAHACAALTRGDGTQLANGLARLPPAEQDGWVELSLESMRRAIRKERPQRTPTPGEIRTLLVAYLASSRSEDRIRFEKVLSTAETASDEDLCWMFRYAGQRVDQADARVVASFERLMVSP